MELRWVLLGFGVVIVLGVYLWGKGLFRSGDETAKPRHKAEPNIGSPDDLDADDDLAGELEASGVEDEDSRPDESEPVVRRRPPEKFVTLRLIPRGDATPSGETVVLALRKHGLEHGRFGIFHCVANNDIDNPVYSVASLTPPGSFDLKNLSESTVPGLTVFMVLPGHGDPVQRFDAMLEVARSLAHELDADLHDEKGSSWSVQRERYIREELIDYRHHLQHC